MAETPRELSAAEGRSCGRGLAAGGGLLDHNGSLHSHPPMARGCGSTRAGARVEYKHYPDRATDVNARRSVRARRLCLPRIRSFHERRPVLTTGREFHAVRVTPCFTQVPGGANASLRALVDQREGVARELTVELDGRLAEEVELVQHAAIACGIETEDPVTVKVDAAAALLLVALDDSESFQRAHIPHTTERRLARGIHRRGLDSLLAAPGAYQAFELTMLRRR